MSRRRLLLAVLLLIAVAAYWLRPNRLTADERPLLGAWGWKRAPQTVSFTFLPDHSFVRRCGKASWAPPVTVGRWWVDGDEVFLDFESSPARRILRPLLKQLNVRVTPVASTLTSDFDLDGTGSARFVRVEPK
jgi:hypothetical protein